MKVKHLDHLNLSVGSLDQSIQWYSKLFGFEVKEHGTYDGIPWAIIQSGDALFCMYEKVDYKFVDNDKRRSQHIHGINHFSLRILEEESWARAIEKHQPKIFYGGSAIKYPHSKSWYVQDPDGYEIEVVLWNDDLIRFDQ